MVPSIRVGTAGWSYPHWAGLVYPKAHAPGFHPLELIAKQLDCVEINSSFYQPLKPEVVKLWIKKVEAYPDFTFTAKLHQDFTHKRVLDQASIALFKEGLWPLLRAKKLGALLMQFPWSFRFTAENREFFIDLRRAFHEFPLVAEMRHSSWMAEEATGTFLDYRVGFCNIDQPHYTRAMPPTAIRRTHWAHLSPRRCGSGSTTTCTRRRSWMSGLTGSSRPAGSPIGPLWCSTTMPGGKAS